jgi:putative colanic acid biosysnthesis UDP-glucose lipid carrier transferase
LSVRYSKYLPAISVAGDFIILNAIFVLGYYLTVSKARFLTEENILFYLYLNLIWFVLSLAFRTGSVSISTRKKKMLYTYIMITVFFFFFFLLFFQVVSLSYYSRDNIKIIFPLFFGVLLLWKFALYYTFVIYRRMGYNYRKVIIVGITKSTRDLSNYFLNNQLNGYRFLGFVSNIKNEKKQVIGTWDDLETIIQSRGVNEIYIGWESVPREALTQITAVANRHPVKIRIVPDFGEFKYKNAELINYDLVPVMQIHPGPLSFWYNRFIKRSFDILFSLIILGLFFWWITLILQILSLMGSRQGVFFRQKRTGLDGKIFWCIKYRTMKKNPDADKVQASRQDLRITPVGKFLRKTSLDELPQFINVLLGQMSVVGPRPHMLRHTSQYRKMVKRFMIRHTIKPGITGLAQVRGYRGEVKRISDIKKRISFDVNYLETWNFILDMKIILLTFKNLIKGDKKAY